MENPCKIVLFGDSILHGTADKFQKEMVKNYPDHQLEIVNMSVGGETSSDGVRRIGEVVEARPDVVVIGFGMNDWRKGISKVQFEKNLQTMHDRFQEKGVRIIYMTIIPDFNGPLYEVSRPGRKGTSPEIDAYNKIILNIVQKNKVRAADVNSLWKKEIKPLQKGLTDAIHPNSLGYQIIVKRLMQIVPRKYLTVLWQFNGKYTACNYACEYCYVPTSVNMGHCFKGNIEEWRQAFKNSFGDQYITFYLSFGEPMIGKGFYDVVEMIGAEPRWDMMMTSNLSLSYDKLLNSRVAKEGRMNINASFHPTQTTKEKFLEKLVLLREHGIESPIVYVMYPPNMERFEEYFEFFSNHGFVMHVRRFCGFYKGKRYPDAYTMEEKKYLAKYMDTASIQYMLNYKSSFGRLSYTGMYLILVNKDGDIEMCDGYIGDGHYGNILKGNAQLDLEPKPFPGLISLGSVDDVASFDELNYHELEDNHVLTFARQGGVYKDKDGKIHYPYLEKGFKDDKEFQKIGEIPQPKKERMALQFNIVWIINHLIKATLKKYFRHGFVFIKGKVWLLKRGKLRLKNLYHS